MFIICPKCSAKYKIPEGTTLENGQKLKCSACDFIFVKEEEKPFVLAPEMKAEETKTVVETPAPVTETTQTEPEFPVVETQTPVWNNIPPVSDTGKSDSLSEAFQPVETPKSKKGLWLIPVYILSIAALCWAGWTFRDSLKPSFKTTFSNITSQKKEVSPSEKALNAIAPKPVIPQKVVVKPLDESQAKEEIQPEKTENVSNILPETKAEEKPVEPVKKVKPKTKTKKAEQKVNEPAPEPVKAEVIAKEEPIVTPKKEDVSEEIVISEPIKVTDLPLAESIEPMNTIAAVEPEPDDIPLFDIVEETKPVESWEDTTWKQDMAVNDLSFRVEINEDGLEQVLVEGEIQNTGLNPHVVPPFDILILNKKGEILNQKKIHLSTNQLEAGEAAPFYTSLVPAPREIDHVDIRF